jgi:flagellar hook-associated protein 1 FlgK
VDRLSDLGRVSVTETTDGMIEVRFGDAATPIVSDREVTWPQALTSPDGTLGALREIFRPGGTVDGYRDALDTVARSLMDAVNSLHASGGGGPFFAATPGDEAGSLRVAAAPAGIVTGASGLAGDNSLALKLAALRGDAAIEGGYRAFVARVGTEVRQARTQEANATALTDAVDGRRQSVSGVSLDEEMSNIIRFQRGYQASSRAMSTMDEMLDVLINRTGRVGL